MEESSSDEENATFGNLFSSSSACIPTCSSPADRDTLKDNVNDSVEEEDDDGMPDFDGPPPYPLPGKHKWLGGAIDPHDGSIYGVPSHANVIIRIRPPPDNNALQNQNQNQNQQEEKCCQVETIPLPLHLLQKSSPTNDSNSNSNGNSNNGNLNTQAHKFKWLRGIIIGDFMYGIPSWCTSGVLMLHLRTQKVYILALPEEFLQGSGILEELPPPKPPKLKKGNPKTQKQKNVKPQKRRPKYESTWLWHGAAPTTDESAIYCIPSNAPRVLQINVTASQQAATSLPNQILIANVTRLVGPTYPWGGNKWYGGIRGKDGAVYGMPYGDSSRVIRMEHDGEEPKVEVWDVPYCKSLMEEDPTAKTGTEEENGSETKVRRRPYQWHGGAYCQKNGCIYAYPSHAPYVLKINTSPTIDTDQRVTLLPIHQTEPPQHILPKPRYQWLGGCIGANGIIYGMPSDAHSILRINPETNKVDTFAWKVLVGNEVTRNVKNKWQGGVLSGVDGCVYAIPSDANVVLRMDTNPSSNKTCDAIVDGEEEEDEDWRVTLVGEELLQSEPTMQDVKDKWQGGFVAAFNDYIYGVPENAPRILRIQPQGGGGGGSGGGIPPLMDFL